MVSKAKGDQMQLINRADGVDQHFCIGRKNHEKNCWEYWAEHCQNFTSAGTVYVGKILAMNKLLQLKDGGDMKMNETSSELSAIDFHVGDHLIQACGDSLTFFIMGDASKEGTTFLNDDLRRILKVAEEQVESC